MIELIVAGTLIALASPFLIWRIYLYARGRSSTNSAASLGEASAALNQVLRIATGASPGEWDTYAETGARIGVHIVDLTQQNSELRKRVEELEIENVELHEDKARLDALQKYEVDTIYLDDGRIIDVRSGNLRLEIDNACKRFAADAVRKAEDGQRG